MREVNTGSAGLSLLSFNFIEARMDLNTVQDESLRREEERQDAEIAKHRLVSAGGWMTYCKISIGVLLALWNATLFIQTIHGWMGWLTAAVAINCEITALYSVHNYPRSIGVHKTWLGRFAIILGGFSLTHAVFAIVHYTGYAEGFAIVGFYSNVIALPLIVVLLSVTVATLSMTHPNARLYASLAKIKIASLADRAKLKKRQMRMRNKHSLARLRAQMFEEQIELEAQLLPLAQRFIQGRTRREEIIAAISDPKLRRQIGGQLDKLFDLNVETGDDDEQPATNQSSAANSSTVENEFPDELDLPQSDPQASKRLTGSRGPLDLSYGSRPTDTQIATHEPGLQVLRQALKDVAFAMPGRWFKAEYRPKHDHIRIRLMSRAEGQERAIKTLNVRPWILDQALKMEVDAFRERLKGYLIKNGFEIS